MTSLTSCDAMQWYPMLCVLCLNNKLMLPKVARSLICMLTKLSDTALAPFSASYLCFLAGTCCSGYFAVYMNCYVRTVRKSSVCDNSDSIPCTIP